MAADQGIVALLPMKAHSARVSSKNFRNFAGKPLYRWILDSLLEVPEISKVVINTDARDILEESGILEISGNSRVLIRDRRSEICGDFVSMNLVLADDIEAVSAETYLMTHTTNPLLSAASIRMAIETYRVGIANDQGDSLFAVNRIQSRFYREDCTPINHDPDNLIRTQDLDPWYEENSNLYIFSKSSFARTNARIGAAPMMFVTPALESVDIDNMDQWKLAEALALYNRQNEV